jgi:hypothetical protein
LVTEAGDPDGVGIGEGIDGGDGSGARSEGLEEELFGGEEVHGSGETGDAS